MKFTVQHIQHDGHNYTLEIVENNARAYAAVFRDSQEIRRIALEKDSDVTVSLKEILESDIQRGAV